MANLVKVFLSSSTTLYEENQQTNQPDLFFKKKSSRKTRVPFKLSELEMKTPFRANSHSIPFLLEWNRIKTGTLAIAILLYTSMSSCES